VQAMNYDCGFSDHLEIEEVILWATIKLIY
jgi:hypothetical protein